MFFIRNQAAQDDSVLRKASIQNIVSHCFGYHVECDEKWCRERFDVSYTHKLLQYGRDLCGEELKKESKSGLRKTCKKCWCS